MDQKEEKNCVKMRDGLVTWLLGRGLVQKAEFSKWQEIETARVGKVSGDWQVALRVNQTFLSQRSAKSEEMGGLGEVAFDNQETAVLLCLQEVSTFYFESNCIAVQLRDDLVTLTRELKRIDSSLLSRIFSNSSALLQLERLASGTSKLDREREAIFEECGNMSRGPEKLADTIFELVSRIGDGLDSRPLAQKRIEGSGRRPNLLLDATSFYLEEAGFSRRERVCILEGGELSTDELKRDQEEMAQDEKEGMERSRRRKGSDTDVRSFENFYE